jgi:PAS domain S-box-containing protein
MHILRANGAVGDFSFLGIAGTVLSTGRTMGDPSEEIGVADNSQPAPAVSSGVFIVWSAPVVLALILAVGAVVVRLLAGPRFDGLLILAACGAAVLVVFRVPRRAVGSSLSTPIPAPSHVAEPLQEILDSAGPAVIAVGLDGCLTYVNPSAERLLGCDAAQLMNEWGITEILAPGESARLVTEMEKLSGVKSQPEPMPAGRMAAYLNCVRALPPSQVPSFDVQLRRKDGEVFPVTLHISALRHASGVISGLVAVAVDQSATLRKEQDLRESQERYRDLFENSSEMIATLSPAGRFLYSNPAWKRCFGLDQPALLALDSFEDVFAPGCRSEVAALFRRALDGELVDRAPLRHHTPDGRLLEFELSLSQRQKAGNPLAVRCLLRDVTHQKRREHRLSLQLVVSQIVGENASPEVASMRILEALCISQGWDLAIKWMVNAKENRLEFFTAWGAPGRHAEVLIQESMGLTLANGVDLPGRAWKQGRPIWIADLNSDPASTRSQSALRQEMVSGWAVPVRVGDNILAVLEFYCNYSLREDRESMAAIETAAASLGQMLAHSQERGRAEELYRQQEILLDSVADGICGVDRQGLVSFANPAAVRLLGTPGSSLTGMSVHDLLHGAAPANHQCAEDCPLRRACSRHSASTGEDNIFRADGSSFPAEYTLTPILDQGHFSGSVLSFRDISQRNALDRLKDEFISTVSHELRTPLTSIRGALGLLSSGMLGDVNEKAANLLRIALTNSDRLVRLINDILDLERIQSGREPLTFRTVQLSDIVRQSIGDIQPVADAAGVRLIHDSTKAEILADPDRLLQVLTNLLSNAVKFSPPNSTVSIMIRPGPTGVTLSVIDQGRGIPADKLEAIFGRFQQVDASDSRQKGGSGLGLAICRTIVLQHSGRIWAERNPVRGSTFRVFLPYRPVPLEMPAAPPEDEPGQGTVLLAGANADARRRIASHLTRHGYNIVESATVDQTVSAARNGVRAVLLDTSLDGMNGWEILPLIRRLEPEARTPVVLLSVDTPHSPGELPTGPSPGVNGWISKPLHEDVLLGELADVLSGPDERARILVVEDDRDLAGVIGGVFSRESIAVQLAYSLEQALDACFTFRPHLLVLDIGLPDGDGFNVVDWLRRHESLARLPLVVYSGRDLSPAERRQLTLGPTHFLAKARVQPQQLEALVLTMLRDSRQTEEAPS